MTGPRIPPKKPPRAAADVTAIDPLRRKHAEDADDALLARSDSAMAANPDLIPGGRYIEAKERRNDRSPVLSTMDQHGVQDIVREMGSHPSPQEAQAAFQRQGGPQHIEDYKPDPELMKMIKAREKMRKHL